MHSSPFFAALLALTPVAEHIPLLAAALVASAWQGLLLTLFVALCLRLLPGLSSAARSTVWAGVLLFVAGLPVLFLTLTTSGRGHGSVLHVEQTVSVVLVALWAAGSAFRLEQLLESAVRLRAVLRRSTPVEASAGVAGLLHAATRPACLCTSADVDRPSVAGLLRPRILLPTALFPQLSEADLTHIVLHEMEHLRRRDDWLNLLQQISLVLFPLNPALLWLNRRLSLERELACDEGVLQTTRARKAYAACLARVAELSFVRRGVSLALGILGDWRRRPELARRVERILATPERRMGTRQMRLATGVMIAGVFGSGALLAHSPTLVSFSPALNPVFPQSAVASGADWLTTSGSLPHPVLVKAVLPAQRTLVNAVEPVARSAHHPHLRSAVRSHLRARTAPWVVLTSWQPPQRPAAPFTHTTPAAFHLAPVANEDSQTWYAAVAWRDGWIVVQL